MEKLKRENGEQAKREKIVEYQMKRVRNPSASAGTRERKRRRLQGFYKEH